MNIFGLLCIPNLQGESVVGVFYKIMGLSSWRTPEVTQINWVTAPDIGQGPDPARSPRFGKRMRGSGSFWSWRPYW